VRKPTRGRLAPPALCTIALLVAAAFPAAADAGFGDRTLRRGSHGGDVRTLQRYLTRLGYPTSVTGSFGGSTQRKVKRYEGARDLRRDGVVGRRQAARIRGEVAALPPPPTYKFGERTLRRGLRGEDVKTLQRVLTKLDFSTPATGYFGSMTYSHVRAYESSQQMKVNGVVSTAQAAKMQQQADAQPTEPASTEQDHFFPIRGPHSYGGAGSRFGAPRSGHTHQGQDVAAASGTPIVSVFHGKVAWKRYQSGGAGNYVVIHGDDGRDYVYMHLLQPAYVSEGMRVTAGQQIGEVGCTGSCSGPHLHFELWTPHWYDGGNPYDPLPLLKRWDPDF
jgi:peptidoglycan hydrolase-like protein with peptidoglycan-binding domain